ncbi:MAG: VCBS repeat-containing protein [Planctomycetaceae bacterium]|nr:VCBS repeat-containing protein [Planctomycetaceae bacterium]
MDVVTPWEEGGLVRVYLHPGHEKSKEPWPAVTVGRVGDPEDAAFADVDNDGTLAVVSCCEGKTQAIFVHRLSNLQQLLDEAAWTTERVEIADGRQWMQCLPIRLSLGRTVLVVGSKGHDGVLGVLMPFPAGEVVASPWRLIPLTDAGWIMSIEQTPNRPKLRVGDANSDRAASAVVPVTQTETRFFVSDRKGPRRGVSEWTVSHDPLAKDGKFATKLRDVGGQNHEVMFLAAGQLGQFRLTNDSDDAVVTTGDGPLLCLSGNGRVSEIPMPQGCGTGKAVAIDDLNGDGRRDLAVTCENAKGTTGVFWLEQTNVLDATDEARWRFHDISGRDGTKFDRIELVDLDGDGDLDLLTCEEAEGLGVIWYENPLK